MTELGAGWSLFWTAFAAATILPFYSEALLIGLLAAGHPPWLLWGFATAGNTLGAVVNWFIGRFLMRFSDRRWFPARQRDVERAQRWYGRWGIWSLLLAWLPIGGDALTVIAGMMRARMLPFLLLVAAGKGARYAVLVEATALAGLG